MLKTGFCAIRPGPAKRREVREVLCLEGSRMSLMLVLHLTFAGIWLGCILVEVAFEHGSGGGDMRLYISKLHWGVDKFIEVPAFMGVLLTGGVLIAQAAMTPLLWTKTAFGAVATFHMALGLAGYKSRNAQPAGCGRHSASRQGPGGGRKAAIAAPLTVS